MRTVILILLAGVLILNGSDAQAARRRRPAAAAKLLGKVARGTIVGRVVDAAGKPVAHARLRVHRGLRRGLHPHLRIGGTFATRKVAPGLFIVNARNALGRGRATALVAAGKTTSVLVHLHARTSHPAHALHALGTRLRVVTKVLKAKLEKEPSAGKTATPKPAGAPRENSAPAGRGGVAPVRTPAPEK